MRNILIIIALLVVIPFSGFSQKRGSRKHHKKEQSAKPVTVPAWATAHNYDAKAHVYFPDYYTFYDPNRGGYVYWEKDKYVFTPALPPFLQQADLSKSRIKILKGLSLDLHPEQNYPYYMNMYPADGNGNTKVPVPIPGNPAK